MTADIKKIEKQLAKLDSDDELVRAHLNTARMALQAALHRLEQKEEEPPNA